jgi:hypothetical protein
MVEFPIRSGRVLSSYVPQRLLFPSIFLLLFFTMTAKNKRGKKAQGHNVFDRLLSCFGILIPAWSLQLPILPFNLRALTTRDLKDKNLYRIAGAAFAGTLPPWLGLCSFCC